LLTAGVGLRARIPLSGHAEFALGGASALSPRAGATHIEFRSIAIWVRPENRGALIQIRGLGPTID
jgi:hypothetical protein